MPYTVAEPQLALALALDDASWIGPHEITNLVSVARRLASVPDPEIDPRFAARLEARIMHEVIEDAPVPTEQSLAGSNVTVLHPVPRTSSIPQAEHAPASITALPRRRFVMRKLVAAVIAAAMLVAFPIVASASSLPGSPFYGLKRFIERAQLQFADGPVSRGFVHIAHANRRLDEADELMAVGRTKLVPVTLDQMEASLQAGTSLILRNAHDESTLLRLQAALKRSTGKLSGMFGSAPVGMKTDILAAIASSKALSQQVAEALGGVVHTGPAAVKAPSASVSAPNALDALNPNLAPNTNVAAPAQPQDPTKPAPGSKDERTVGEETQGSCQQQGYVGPGGDAVQSTCDVTWAGNGGIVPPHLP